MTASQSTHSRTHDGKGLGAQLRTHVRQFEKKAQAGLDKLEKQANARWSKLEKRAAKLGRQANDRFAELEDQARSNARRLAKDLDRGLGGLQDQVLDLLGIASKSDVERLSKKLAGIARKVGSSADAA